MEKKDLIVRRNLNGNRRSLYVYLTDKGRIFAEQVVLTFGEIEERAMLGFSDEEKEMLNTFLARINKNMRGDVGNE